MMFKAHNLLTCRVHRYLFICAMAFGLLLWFLQAPVAAAESAGIDVLFVLDGSGSMWGRLDGREKIVHAKQTLASLIRNTPDGARLGLVAYGHRRKGDCGDIETLVPIGYGDKELLIRQLNAITPQGKTPIAGVFAHIDRV